jgi:MYXO-CTERM domain-containing protein
MRILKAFFLSLTLAAIPLTQAEDASACGGCLVQQTESTQVTGHRMILSISMTQTTLWDQITYSGNPSSFAWVLPTKGVVEIGLSSDALFQALDSATNVIVSSPNLQCSPPPDCGYRSEGDANGGSTGAVVLSPPVDVLAQEVVGPYETVQLKSTDPNALKNWLVSHNYNVPADISPVIDAYVSEGFNFLALKLVPGQGVSAMRPVRVTTPGGSPVLPLRMVAAGTGAVTPITLWVLAEGRYETVNLPVFTIDSKQLVWDWDTQSSNYATLRKAGFANSKGTAWLVEAGEPMSKFILSQPLTSLAQYDPTNSGYADSMGEGAELAVAGDLNALFGSISDTSLWVTRLHGELARTALAGDLDLGASADQTQINRYLVAEKSVGTTPACPTFPPCAYGDASNGGWDFWGNQEQGSSSERGSCAMTEGGHASTLMGGLALAAALTVSRLRRRRR